MVVGGGTSKQQTTIEDEHKRSLSTVVGNGDKCNIK
jgi:hypothetical protein